MKLTKWFLKVAGFILTVTAVAKIVSAGGEARILNRPDPIFDFLNNRQLMLLVGSIELGVAWTIFFKSDTRLSTFLVTWLTGSFLIYRVGLWWIGYEGECSCLGELTNAIGMNAGVAQNMMLGILGFLVVGSAYAFPTVFWSKGEPGEVQQPASKETEEVVRET